MGVVHKYLDQFEIDEETKKELEKSLSLIKRRADGESSFDSLSRRRGLRARC